MGNITQIRQDGALIASYTYDEQNQLLSEILYARDLKYTYEYDTYGNIRSAYTYRYSTGTLLDFDRYTYGDATWLDKMTAFNGAAIT